MSIRLLSSAALAVILVVASGCATTSKVMLGSPRAPIAAEQVRIYYTPPTGYVEIALLETHSGGFTYGDQNKTNEVFAKLRAEAAKLGANGVLFQGAQDAYGGSNVGVGVGAGRYGGHTRIGGGVGVSVSPTPKYARGIAIFVADPPPEN